MARDQWGFHEEPAKRSVSISAGTLLAVGGLVSLLFLGALAVRTGKLHLPGGAGAHTLTGDVTLVDFREVAKRGDGCVGSGGYGDLEEGAAVTIKNQSGTLIGTGSLQAGQISGEKFTLKCKFPFEVTGVKNADFFQVEVTHRGGLSYSKAEMEKSGWTVHATLGG